MPELLGLGIGEAQAVVWHRHQGRTLGLERQLQIAAYISEGAKSLITPCLPLLSISFPHSPTNLPSSSPQTRTIPRPVRRARSIHVPL